MIRILNINMMIIINNKYYWQILSWSFNKYFIWILWWFVKKIIIIIINVQKRGRIKLIRINKKIMRILNIIILIHIKIQTTRIIEDHKY